MAALHRRSEKTISHHRNSFEASSTSRRMLRVALPLPEATLHEMQAYLELETKLFQDNHRAADHHAFQDEERSDVVETTELMAGQSRIKPQWWSSAVDLYEIGVNMIKLLKAQPNVGTSDATITQSGETYDMYSDETYGMYLDEILSSDAIFDMGVPSKEETEEGYDYDFYTDCGYQDDEVENKVYMSEEAVLDEIINTYIIEVDDEYKA
jgi:hypothetical protein